MTLDDLNPDFKVTALFDAKYSQKRYETQLQ